MSDREDGEIEDGEIETDDETPTQHGNDVPQQSQQQQQQVSSISGGGALQPAKASPEKHASGGGSGSSNRQMVSNKEPIEDDWANNVEKAIANALKKDGVEPPLPNISVKMSDQMPQTLMRSKRKKKPKSERRRNKRLRDEEDQKKDSSNHKDQASQQQQTGGGNPSAAPSQPTMVVDLMDVDVDEYEMLGMRGGSPVRQSPSVAAVPEVLIDSDASSSSFESDDYNQKGGNNNNNNNARGGRGYVDRNKRRSNSRSRTRNDRGNSGNKRQRLDRDRRDRDRGGRDRDRDRKSDDERREPRKMEICKFYLIDCCAKRNNCSYLHSEFPCKYYYLGMECPNKDCKFNHGKPLTTELRGILLKHLETAPKDILGDFPRVGREKAIKMMDAAHVNLTRQERGEPPLEQPIKLPSLLDGMRRESKQRRSRWCDEKSDEKVTSHSSSNDTEPAKEQISVRVLHEILTPKQIEDMITMKIENIEQIKQLTLLQMTDLGLTFQQVSEIQAKALNMQKEQEEKTTPIAPTIVENKDLDLRESLQQPQPQPDSGDIDLREKDVDLRIIPQTTLASVPITAALHAMDNAKQLETNTTTEPNYADFPAPSIVNYSQYLKDSQIDKDDEKETTAEDECELQIDESWNSDDDDDRNDGTTGTGGSSNMKDSDKKTEDSSFMSPVHTQESLIASLKQLEKEKQQNHQPTYLADLAFPSFYDKKAEDKAPQDTMPAKTEEHRRPSINEIKSPSSGASSGGESPVRMSIYDMNADDDDDEEDLDAKINARIIKGDRDMRITSILMDNQESKDIDLRLPFKPMMADYIPATEIDASITQHPTMDYHLFECEIPKPDYSELRRSKHSSNSSDALRDPRLRRLLGIKAEKKDKSEPLPQPVVNHLPPQIASPDPYTSSKITSPPLSSPPSCTPAPVRADPRDPRRRLRDDTSNSATPNIPAHAPFKEPNQLDAQQVLVLLQKSPWYQDLSSNNKILVNQHLATLSAELKRFHQDPAPGKVFDVTIVTTNNWLSGTLSNLGVFLNENGYFCLVEDAKETTPKPSQQQQTNLVPNLPNLMTTPPPNLLIPPGLDLNLLNQLRPLLAAAATPNPFGIRPGILSVPPPGIFNDLRGGNLFPQQNFPPQSLLGGGNMGGPGGNNNRHDNFRDGRQQQDNRRNWNNNRNNNRHNNRRRN